MAYQTKAMCQDTYLQAATAVLYTVPAATRSIVKEIILCNTDTNAIAVTMNYLKDGGTLAKGTILSAVSFAAGETKILSLSSVLNAGDAVKGLAGTADKVTVSISGIEENV
jgi:hypothetical protein